MIQDIGYLIFRVCFAGLYFVTHGLPRISHFNVKASSLSMVAMLVEFGAALLVAVGFATRLMATGIVIFLLFIFQRYYHKLPWVMSELSLVYAMGFLGIALLGPGRLSFDSFFGWFKRR
jgi:uncharacterized membrane protein YphA (DoxX/SURF4 family)